MSQEAAEMFAASGTTARIMYAAMFFLHDSISSLKLLQEELDKAIPDANAIPSTKILESMPYLVSPY